MEVAATSWEKEPSKGRCGMSSATVIGKSLGQSQPKRWDRRRGVRKSVRLHASIVTANGIATCHVTDISGNGCRVHLFRPLTLHQYLALEIKLGDAAGEVHIPLAQVQWINNLIAGVEFVYLSRSHLRMRRTIGGVPVFIELE
jgi:hypothetical protein